MIDPTILYLTPYVAGVGHCLGCIAPAIPTPDLFPWLVAYVITLFNTQ